MSSRLKLRMVSGGVMLLCAGIVCGQDYPNKPVRIVTSGAGGGSDVMARLVAHGVAGPLGQSVIVDNRANALQSAEVVSKASPDGYTLLVTGAILWITPLLQKAPYDAVRDFSPISLLVREVNVLVVHPSLPVKSVKELIVLAKAKPGALNYASTGAGSVAHLAGELFKSTAGVNLVRVPFKGGAAVITGLISGEVQLTFADAGLVMPHWKSGRLRALAVTTAEPSALAPGLPTVAASGVPGYEMLAMTCLFAPGKTPATIINRLNQEVVRAFNQADMKEKILAAGVETVAGSPESLAATIKSEIAKWSKVINDAGIKPD